VIPRAFSLEAGETLIDQDHVILGLRLKGSPYPLYMEELLHTPVLSSQGIRWDDRPGGNGNGIMEEEEWLTGRWTISNTGHFRTGEVTGQVAGTGSTPLSEFQLDSPLVLFPGDSSTLSFTCRIGSLPDGWFGWGGLEAGDGELVLKDSLRISIGRYLEDFSSGPGGFPFKDQSENPWRTDPSTYASPGLSLRSGHIGHLDSSIVSISLECPDADSISFAFRVSSESGYDFLVFKVDSLVSGSWSGEHAWGVHTDTLAAGHHLLSWTYLKDQNTSRGEDAAWIDDIRFPGTAFRNGDVALTEILNPDRGPWLPGGEALRYRIRNLSPDTLDRLTLRYSLNGEPFASDSFAMPLLPGEAASFTSGEIPPMADTGYYVLGASILSDSLGYSGNNVLNKEVFRYAFPDLGLELLRMDTEPGVRADLQAGISNKGNVALDSLVYTLWLDDMLRDSGSRFIGLLPGQQTELSFSLADSSTNRVSGDFPYLLASTLHDSIPANNNLEGLLQWWMLGSPDEKPEATWQLLPNPAREYFKVVLSEAARTDLYFDLLDPGGRLIRNYLLPAGERSMQVDIQSLAPGSYILRQHRSAAHMNVIVIPR
jgi:hypothetical protein